MGLPAEMQGGDTAADTVAEPTDADLAALVDETEGAAASEVEAKPAVEGETKPDEAVEGDEKKPEVEAKPPADETPEAEKLRKGFAALARDRRKMHEREQAAEAAIATADQYKTKATHFDAVVKRLHDDPHALLLEAGGEELVN